MAYFSNGTEGMEYEGKYCDNCVNFRDHDDTNGEVLSCPIWDAHFLFNYDQCKDTSAGKAIKEVLDRLIPTDDAGFPAECLGFIAKTELADKEAEYLEKLRFSDELTFGFPEKL